MEFWQLLNNVWLARKNKDSLDMLKEAMGGLILYPDSFLYTIGCLLWGVRLAIYISGE